jgi:hypothetical protein
MLKSKSAKRRDRARKLYCLRDTSDFPTLFSSYTFAHWAKNYPKTWSNTSNNKKNLSQILNSDIILRGGFNYPQSKSLWESHIFSPTDPPTYKHGYKYLRCLYLKYYRSLIRDHWDDPMGEFIKMCMESRN